MRNSQQLQEFRDEKEEIKKELDFLRRKLREMDDESLESESDLLDKMDTLKFFLREIMGKIANA